MLGLASEIAIGAQQPIFRSRVDLVTVDATVTGPDGRAVNGLDASDFRLHVDGQTRRVVAAQYVEFDRRNRAPPCATLNTSRQTRSMTAGSSS